MKYNKLLVLALIMISCISCKQKKNKEMLKTDINPCGIKNEELNIIYITDNIKKISRNEDCVFYILDNIIKDYSKNRNKAIAIFDIICSNVGLEPLSDYSYDFFKKDPKYILDYLHQNPKSSIKENIIVYLNYYYYPSHKGETIQSVFNKIEKENLSANQKKELKSIYNSIIFNYRGTIVDKDGFVNLRKDKNANSDIIQKIDSGDEVIVKNTIDDWWEIETRKGYKGYIHKSRVKLK